MTIRILFIILCLVIAPQTLATAAKVYVWTNEDGVLVFSDSPKPGAEEVPIDESKANIIESSIDTSVLDIKPKVIKDNFVVDLIQPEDNDTIRDNTGSVHVSGLIKPVFKQGMLIQLYLDNKPHKKPQAHSMFALREIDRGEHQLRMDLIDKSGKVIASSKTITFYMHRASVGN